MQIRSHQWIRYLLAVVLSSFIAEVLGFPFALALDVTWGREVTGGVWAFTIPNMILMLVKGSLLGIVAGSIAGANGKLLAALANFFPLIAVLIISASLHRDFLRSMPSATNAMLWTFLCVVPATIAGGYAASKIQTSAAPIFTLVGAAMGFVVPFAALVFHVYTVVIAYQLSGFGGAVAAFIFPVISEIWYSWHLWGISQTIWNPYTARFLLLVLWGGTACLLLGIGNYLEQQDNVLNPGHSKKG